MIHEEWTTRYSQLHRPNARSIARHVALDVASRFAWATGRTQAALARPRVHFVYLHHVFEDEVEPFRRLVDALLHHMTPLAYGDAVDRAIRGPIDRPYVAFSFDDGFKNNLAAADVLDAAGAKACFFICPAVVDAASDGRDTATFARERLHLPPIEFTTWDDVASLNARGHAIGNHTRDHLNLGEPATNAWRQIADGVKAICYRDIACEHFAWPYGHDRAIFSPAVEAAFANRHASVASGIRGAHVVSAGEGKKLCIRREHLIAAWPLRHCLHLLGRSAAHATAADNDWPSIFEVSPNAIPSPPTTG